MSSLNENVLSAMGTIASVINKKYDITKICTIVDDSQASLGKYEVKNGLAKFQAVSDKHTYKKNDVVRVLIPEGNMEEKKFITGLYSVGEQNEIIYSQAKDKFVPMDEFDTNLKLDFSASLPQYNTTEQSQFKIYSFQPKKWIADKKILEGDRYLYNSIYFSFIPNFINIPEHLTPIAGTFYFRFRFKNLSRTDKDQEIIFSNSDFIGSPFCENNTSLRQEFMIKEEDLLDYDYVAIDFVIEDNFVFVNENNQEIVLSSDDKMAWGDTIPWPEISFTDIQIIDKGHLYTGQRGLHLYTNSNFLFNTLRDTVSNGDEEEDTHLDEIKNIEYIWYNGDIDSGFRGFYDITSNNVVLNGTTTEYDEYTHFIKPKEEESELLAFYETNKDLANGYPVDDVGIHLGLSISKALEQIEQLTKTIHKLNVYNDNVYWTMKGTYCPAAEPNTTSAYDDWKDQDNPNRYYSHVYKDQQSWKWGNWVRNSENPKISRDDYAIQDIIHAASNKDGSAKSRYLIPSHEFKLTTNSKTYCFTKKAYGVLDDIDYQIQKLKNFWLMQKDTAVWKKGTYKNYPAIGYRQYQDIYNKNQNLKQHPLEDHLKKYSLNTEQSNRINNLTTLATNLRKNVIAHDAVVPMFIALEKTLKDCPDQLGKVFLDVKNEKLISYLEEFKKYLQNSDYTLSNSQIFLNTLKIADNYFNNYYKALIDSINILQTYSGAVSYQDLINSWLIPLREQCEIAQEDIDKLKELLSIDDNFTKISLLEEIQNYHSLEKKSEWQPTDFSAFDNKLSIYCYYSVGNTEEKDDLLGEPGWKRLNIKQADLLPSTIKTANFTEQQTTRFLRGRPHVSKEKISINIADIEEKFQTYSSFQLKLVLFYNHQKITSNILTFKNDACYNLLSQTPYIKLEWTDPLKSSFFPIDSNKNPEWNGNLEMQIKVFNQDNLNEELSLEDIFLEGYVSNNPKYPYAVLSCHNEAIFRVNDQDAGAQTFGLSHKVSTGALEDPFDGLYTNLLTVTVYYDETTFYSTTTTVLHATDQFVRIKGPKMIYFLKDGSFRIDTTEGLKYSLTNTKAPIKDISVNLIYGYRNFNIGASAGQGDPFSQFYISHDNELVFLGSWQTISKYQPIIKIEATDEKGNEYKMTQPLLLLNENEKTSQEHSFLMSNGFQSNSIIINQDSGVLDFSSAILTSKILTPTEPEIDDSNNLSTYSRVRSQDISSLGRKNNNDIEKQNNKMVGRAFMSVNAPYFHFLSNNDLGQIEINPEYEAPIQVSNYNGGLDIYYDGTLVFKDKDNNTASLNYYGLEDGTSGLIFTQIEVISDDEIISACT